MLATIIIEIIYQIICVHLYQIRFHLYREHGICKIIKFSKLVCIRVKTVQHLNFHGILNVRRNRKLMNIYKCKETLDFK